MSNQEPHSLLELLHRYAAELTAVLTRRAGAQEAEDIVQDACVRWLEHADMEQIRDPRAFLFTTAINLSIDRARKDGVRRRCLEEGLDLDTLAAPTPGAEQIVETQQQLQRLLDTLAELPERQRHAFLLNKVDGLTHEAIARRLGVSTKTVRRDIRLTLAHCAERLSD